MVRKTRVAGSLGFTLTLTLLFAACSPPAGAVIQPTSTPAVSKLAPSATVAVTAEAQTEATPTLVPDENTPEGTALLFFSAYVEASRAAGDPLERADFTARQYLSPEYLAQVAEIRAGFEGAGFDPVLHAQDVPPGSVKVSEARVEEEQATVVLVWDDPALTNGWTRSVSLKWLDDAWRIVPDQVEDGALDPERTVEAFYAWYLDYASAGTDWRSPLADQAYHEAPYLTGQFVGKVDQILAAFAEQDQGGYDPFLCAQDVPPGIEAIAHFYNSGRPTVLVQTGFPGHFINVDLVRADFNRWAIRDITCASAPEGLAKALYTSALGYGNEKGRHFWAEGLYRESEFLTRAFIESLDEQAAAEPAADPLLLAQTPPLAFNTGACAEPNCAVVNLQYGPDRVEQLRLSLEAEDGKLRIAGVSHPAMPESPLPAVAIDGVEQWLPYTDEQYGFTLRYPAGWHITGLQVTDRHTAAEYPVMRSLQFLETPGAGQPVSVLVDVVVGDQAVFDAQYGWLNAVEIRDVNGQPAQVLRSDQGWLYYAFQPPARPGTWVVFVDAVSQAAGREDQAASYANVVEAMLSTLRVASE